MERTEIFARKAAIGELTPAEIAEAYYAPMKLVFGVGETEREFPFSRHMAIREMIVSFAVTCSTSLRFASETTIRQAIEYLKRLMRDNGIPSFLPTDDSRSNSKKTLDSIGLLCLFLLKKEYLNTINFNCFGQFLVIQFTEATPLTIEDGKALKQILEYIEDDERGSFERKKKPLKLLLFKFIDKLSNFSSDIKTRLKTFVTTNLSQENFPTTIGDFYPDSPAFISAYEKLNETHDITKFATDILLSFSTIDFNRKKIDSILEEFFTEEEID